MIVRFLRDPHDDDESITDGHRKETRVAAGTKDNQGSGNRRVPGVLEPVTLPKTIESQTPPTKERK